MNDSEEHNGAGLMRGRWRLVNSACHDGATNMAIDEAILQGVAEHRSPATLRFYAWDPPCVSIGYAQSLRTEIDLEACRSRGYGWVRRPTGGRAVLHIDELTYSVIAPLGEPRVRGDIVTSYRRISLGLLAGLRFLGCEAGQADLRQEPDAKAGSAACFEMPSHYEVMAQGRKLVGSAQVRRRGVVLQHGALPLTGDVSRLAQVLAVPDSERAQLQDRLCRRAIALDESLGRHVTFDEAVGALTRGFAEALNLDLEPGDLSGEEYSDLDRLRAMYMGDDWTFSR